MAAIITIYVALGSFSPSTYIVPLLMLAAMSMVGAGAAVKLPFDTTARPLQDAIGSEYAEGDFGEEGDEA